MIKIDYPLSRKNPTEAFNSIKPHQLELQASTSMPEQNPQALIQCEKITSFEKQYDLSIILNQILQQLPQDQSTFIIKRYFTEGLESNYQSIAEELGIGLADVRKLEKRTIKNILTIKGSSPLEGYL
ncbi:MAG: hypothetical protein KJ674_04910 [Nanoarchaeota archaeon]|nr:hypothetical protein [Nanoarchaeota archaeon]